MKKQNLTRHEIRKMLTAVKRAQKNIDRILNLRQRCWDRDMFNTVDSIEDIHDEVTTALGDVDVVLWDSINER